MKLPVRPQTGQRIPKNWFRDLYDYIAAMTTIRGDGRNLAVTQTDAGQIIRFVGNSAVQSGGRNSSSPSRVRIKNGNYGTQILAGSPIMLSSYPNGGGSGASIGEYFYAFTQLKTNWNDPDARCIAVSESNLSYGEEGTAIVSGIALGIMNASQTMYEGNLLCPDGQKFVPTQSGYVGPTAKIVRIGSYNSELEGTEVQVLLGGVGVGGSGDSFQYNGPWALWMNMDTINVNPGLIWTPDGAKLVSPGSCNKPSVSSMIVLDYTSGGRLTTVQGDIDQWATNYTNYFNTHALLGRYDAETDSVIQYHFSPIVHLIETEDFVIEPE